MHCDQMKKKRRIRVSGLLASVVVGSVMVNVPHGQAQAPCTHYASPSGSGNGLSQGSPFQIAKFWSVATPGKVLCLLDGTYTGGITPPDTFAGTASQPITIRALNEGEVLIDGGTSKGAYLRGSYGILEGVNVKGGDNSTFTISYYSDHWIARRIVIWNDTNANNNVDNMVELNGTNGLLEDCAVFGKGRKLVTLGAGGGGGGNRNNVVRRCWSRWENRTPGGSPTNTFEMGYYQDGVTYENLIGTRGCIPGCYSNSPEPPFELFMTKNSKWLGSISYVPPEADYASGGLLFFYGDGGSGHYSENVLLKDIVGYISPANPAFSVSRPFRLDQEVVSNVNLRVDNLVGVAGATGSCSEPSWQGCNTIRTGRSLAEAIGPDKSVWREVPGICHRYVNGQLTNDPLWPWPMNQRIKDALVQSGRAPVDVTQTMESMFGPIPQECKTASSQPVEVPKPRNLRVIGAN
jgi:hypothetical protein